jgi:hypothetical protein
MFEYGGQMPEDILLRVTKLLIAEVQACCICEFHAVVGWARVSAKILLDLNLSKLELKHGAKVTWGRGTPSSTELLQIRVDLMFG